MWPAVVFGVTTWVSRLLRYLAASALTVGFVVVVAMSLSGVTPIVGLPFAWLVSDGVRETTGARIGSFEGFLVGWGLAIVVAESLRRWMLRRHPELRATSGRRPSREQFWDDVW